MMNSQKKMTNFVLLITSSMNFGEKSGLYLLKTLRNWYNQTQADYYYGQPQEVNPRFDRDLQNQLVGRDGVADTQNW